MALPYASHEVSPRWVYADTLSWTRGKHSFKFGGEYRMSSTKSTLGGSVQTGAKPSNGHHRQHSPGSGNGYRQDRVGGYA